jgi:hypothetical protein
MKVFFALMALTFLGIFSYFGLEEFERFETNRAISASGGFAPGAADGVETVNKRFGSYKVKVKYEVGGKAYRFATTSTDEAGVRQYLAMPLDVLYDTKNPSTATLRRYYDLRREDETLFQVLVVPAVLAIGAALPVAALVALLTALIRRRRK